MLVTANKQENIKRAVEFISLAAKNNAKIVSLPVSWLINTLIKLRLIYTQNKECFNSPYGIKYFPDYSENIPNGETSEALAKAGLHFT